MNALLALGSNLDNPVQQVLNAMHAIDHANGIEVLACASLYSSSPRGPQDQDDYVNSAVLIDTSLSPLALLEATQGIENAFGRVKTRIWGERVIDIDIAYFGQQTINVTQPDLCIPHKEAHIRDFVLIPCLEIAADWVLPDGSLLSDASKRCIHHNLVKIDLNLACS